MSVSQVERRNSGEEASKSRQETQEKEVEMMKRQRKQIDSINKQHTEDMRKLNAAYSNALGEQKEKYREIMTERDHKYQAEMNELKKMNTQKQRELSEKNLQDVSDIRTVKDEEMRNDRQRSEMIKQNIERGSLLQLKEKDRQASIMAEDFQRSQKEALEKQHGRLTASYGEKINAQQETRDKEMAQKLKDLEVQKETARTTENVLKDEKDRAIRRQERFFMGQLQEERKNSQEILDLNRTSQQASLKEEANKFSMQAEKRNQLQNDFQSDLRTTVQRRQDDVVDRLEQKLHTEKTRNFAAEQNRRRLDGLETNHVMRAAEERIQEANGRAVNAQQSAQEQSTREIKQMNKTNNEIVKAQGRRYEDRIENLKTNEIAEYRRQLDMNRNRDENRSSESIARDKKVTSVHQREVAGKTDYYEAKLGDVQKIYSEQLRDHRERSAEERNSLTNRFEGMIRKVEAGHELKLTEIQNRYEDEIAKLKMLSEKDLRRAKELDDQKTKEQQRRFQTEFDRERGQNIVQREQLREKFEKEIEILKKHHEQEKIDLSRRKV